MIFGMATGMQLLEGLVFGIFRHLRRYSFITNLMTKPDDVPVSEKHELLTTHSYAPVALRENGLSGYSRLVRLAAFKTLIRVPGPGKIELDAGIFWRAALQPFLMYDYNFHRLFAETILATGMMTEIPENFTIDVHTHAIPTTWKEELIKAGYEAEGTQPIIDGFLTPEWDIDMYMKNRDEFGYNYSVMSIGTPGVNFLKGKAATDLARRVNDEMAGYVKNYPSRLGAMALLPFPNLDDCLVELKYCLDELKFHGVGFFSNFNGIYLGDAALDPLMEELNRRKATIFVHPSEPSPMPQTFGISASAIEYPFETTRAITNILFKKARAKFPDVNIIFPHGGGTIPILAERIASQATIPYQGGQDIEFTSAQLKGYYFDLCTANGFAQLTALKAYIGSSKLLAGSDFPYFPADLMKNAQKRIYGFEGFSKEDMKAIRHGNALKIFPTILDRIQDTSCQTIFEEA